MKKGKILRRKVLAGQHAGGIESGQPGGPGGFARQAEKGRLFSKKGDSKKLVINKI